MTGGLVRVDSGREAPGTPCRSTRCPRTRSIGFTRSWPFGFWVRPTSAVTLIDRDRQWMKAVHGPVQPTIPLQSARTKEDAKLHHDHTKTTAVDAVHEERAQADRVLDDERTDADRKVQNERALK